MRVLVANLRILAVTADFKSRGKALKQKPEDIDSYLSDLKSHYPALKFLSTLTQLDHMITLGKPFAKWVHLLERLELLRDFSNFEIETAWHILSGAPPADILKNLKSTEKSRVQQILEREGYQL